MLAGTRFLIPGRLHLRTGCCFLVPGKWSLVPGAWCPSPGSCFLVRVRGSLLKVPDWGFLIVGSGLCFIHDVYLIVPAVLLVVLDYFIWFLMVAQIPIGSNC